MLEAGHDDIALVQGGGGARVAHRHRPIARQISRFLTAMSPTAGTSSWCAATKAPYRRIFADLKGARGVAWGRATRPRALVIIWAATVDGRFGLMPPRISRRSISEKAGATGGMVLDGRVFSRRCGAEAGLGPGFKDR